MNKVIPVVLGMVMMLFLTIPVMADEVETYPLWIGGTQVTSENAADIDKDGKLSYDAKSKTLTVKEPDCISGEGLDSEYNSIIRADEELTIVAPNGLNLLNESADNAIYGTKGITVKGNVTTQCEGNAIYSRTGNILIEGNVNLTSNQGGSGCIAAPEGNITLKGDAAIQNNGDSISCEKELHVKGNIEAKGRVYVRQGPAVIEGNISAEGNDIYDAIRIEGNPGDKQQGTLSVNGDVNVNATKASGIYAQNLIHLNGNVTASGNTGICAKGDLEILGGTCEITGSEQMGIDAVGAIRLVSGDLNVTGNWNAIYSEKGNIEIGEDVTSLTATGGSTSRAMNAGAENGLTIHRFLRIDEPENGSNAGKYIVDSEGNSVTKVALVQKPMPEIQQAPSANSGLRENGKVLPLLKAGSATGGVMNYAIGTKTSASGEYADTIPTATKTGTYYVWYKVVGDDDHRDTVPACITVSVAKSAYQVAVEKAQVAKTKITKAKNKKKRKVLVKWKKTAGVSGYQIQYSTVKSFKKKVKTKKVSASKTKVVLKKLKKGKKYYIKVRPYTKVRNNITGKSRIVYGKYSNVKKVKIKK